MARRSSSSAPQGRKPTRRGPTAAPSSSASACPACGVALLAEARFCHACGRGLGATAATGPWTAKTITLAAGFVALVAAATVGAGVLVTQYKAGKAPVGRTAAAPVAQPAPSVDISRMSPREAADRLFNRVMAAREGGDLDEARRFAPMAVQAYGRVAVLDDDAHYHLGQIHVTAGDLEGARREIAILQEATPNHLLALVLAHDVAVQADDPAAARRAAAAFAAAYAAEIATKRPEYEAHRRTIDEFHALTLEAGELLSGAAPPKDAADAPAPAQPAVTTSPPGAALFDKNCARCHGRNAAGGPGGPPLVHEIYHPGHHADAAFHLAVRRGVRAHHWSFGDMPAIPGVTEAEVDQIIAYVRALQVAAGIE